MTYKGWYAKKPTKLNQTSRNTGGRDPVSWAVHAPATEVVLWSATF